MAVAVTGMGVVCAGGRDVRELWLSVVAGRAHASWFADRRAAVHRVALELPSAAGELSLRRADRSVRMAVQAAREAAEASELRSRPIPPERLGVFIGTPRGPVGTWSQAAERA